nr:MAG TPA: hypothetical protein [Caudoviricetes sp.]
MIKTSKVFILTSFLNLCAHYNIFYTNCQYKSIFFILYFYFLFIKVFKRYLRHI